jgi:hypothetical protein
MSGSSRPGFGLARAAPLLVIVLFAGTGLAWLAVDQLDFDEVEHAHVLWLLAQGKVLFRDFFELHFPWMWLWHEPLARLESALPLEVWWRVFRLSSFLAASGAVLAAVWFGTRSSAAADEPLDRALAWLVVGYAAVSVPFIDFATEFRPDTWTYPLILAGSAAFVRDRRAFVFGLLATIGVSFTPKLALLPPLLLGASVILCADVRQRMVPILVRGAAGTGVAVLALIALLHFGQVDPRLAWASAIEYQRAYHATTQLTSLWQQVTGDLLLFWPLAGAIGAGVAMLAVLRRGPSPFELAAAVQLAWLLMVVQVPFKQFAGPWFLLAAALAASGLMRLPARAKMAVAGLFLAALLATAERSLLILQEEATFHAEMVRAEHLLSLVPEGQPVAIAPPAHPVVRPMAFRSWACPREGGEAAARVDLGPINDAMGVDGVFDELTRDPPALLAPPYWCKFQRDAAKRYLQLHRDEYEERRELGFRFVVSKALLARSSTVAPP